MQILTLCLRHTEPKSLGVGSGGICVLTSPLRDSGAYLSLKAIALNKAITLTSLQKSLRKSPIFLSVYLCMYIHNISLYLSPLEFA